MSNLVFLSKIIERVVLIRLDDYMNKNNLQGTAQYRYKKGESTETMLLEIVNVLVAFDENKATVILFLDLSAAFDTIDIQNCFTFCQMKLVLGEQPCKDLTAFSQEEPNVCI